MGSLEGEISTLKKPTWFYPKMLGYNPSEIWGHSACYYSGLIYIFGGCRGGVHFSDVLVCDLSTTTWGILKTTGQGPGPRDSHTSVVFGHSMLVFGGTNGYKKVNDVHVLDLLTHEWTRPTCCGTPPCPRESHTANVIGEDKMVIFGGSGEGESNYLNDLHILDLKTMEWSSLCSTTILSCSGSDCMPAPCDSHSSVVVGDRLFVFGGDSGDRYQGDVRVFDTNKLVWSRVDARGASPNARAGHASVSIGTKVYVIGGVGDKRYYDEIWVFDVITSSWSQLEIDMRCSQGRFSHTATVTNWGIVIFGGCGEDERPLNELLILQIDSLTSSRDFEHKSVDKTKSLFTKSDNTLQKTTILVDESEDSGSHDVEELEFVPKHNLNYCSDTLPPKRRRASYPNIPSDKPDLDAHIRPQSQQSSSSQSDHEQTLTNKSISSSFPSSTVHPLFRQKIPSLRDYKLTSDVLSSQAKPIYHIPRTNSDSYLSTEHLNQIRKDHHACGMGTVARNMLGAEVRGQVDGAFDSGYLMTATVNGKIFRGVLFAHGSDRESRRANIGQHHSIPTTRQIIGVNRVKDQVNNSNLAYGYPPNNSQQQQHAAKWLANHDRSSEQNKSRRSHSDVRNLGNVNINSELQGVVLTLASPGINDHHQDKL